VNTDDHIEQRATGRTAAECAPVERYEIRVAGRLGSRWDTWFDGLTVAPDADGTTVISGPIVDQAALHGLLQQLRDLGITLLSLTRTAPGGPTAHPISPNDTDTTGATP